MKKKKDIETKSKYTKNTFYTQVIMTIIAAVFLVPVFVIINYSFKTKKELYMESPLPLPNSFNFDNYIKAFNKLDMVTTFSNTLLYLSLIHI